MPESAAPRSSSAAPSTRASLAVGAKPGVTYNYEPAPKDILDKVAKIEKVCADHKVPLAAAALQFPLTHPSVCSVIPGSRSVEELKRNLDLFRHPIPTSLWSDLKSAGLMRADAPHAEIAHTEVNWQPK